MKIEQINKFWRVIINDDGSKVFQQKCMSWVVDPLKSVIPEGSYWVPYSKYLCLSGPINEDIMSYREVWVNAGNLR